MLFCLLQLKGFINTDIMYRVSIKFKTENKRIGFVM